MDNLEQIKAALASVGIETCGFSPTPRPSSPDSATYTLTGSYDTQKPFADPWAHLWSMRRSLADVLAASDLAGNRGRFASSST